MSSKKSGSFMVLTGLLLRICRWVKDWAGQKRPSARGSMGCHSCNRGKHVPWSANNGDIIFTTLLSPFSSFLSMIVFWS